MSSNLEWNPSLIDEGFSMTIKHREEILINLRDLINNYSKNSFSKEDIDMICGYWLEVFTQNIYTAWREILNGYIPKKKAKKAPRIKFLSNVHTYASESYWHEHLRWVVFSVLSNQNLGNFLVTPNREQSNATTKYGYKSFNIQFRLKKNLSKLSKNPQILFYCPDFRCSNLEKFRFIYKNKNIISYLSSNLFHFESFNMDWQWRLRKSAEYIYDDTFLSLVLNLLPLYTPIEILESLNFNQEKFLSLDLNAPKVLFTSGGLVQSPKLGVMMKIWKQNGTKLVIQQHGGGYGLDRQMTIEDYEKRNSDYFCTWGKRKSSPNSVYLSPSSPNLIWGDFNLRKKNILFICNDVPIYPNRLQYSPWGKANRKMHLDVEFFLQNIKSKKDVLIRDYIHLSKWNKFANKKNNFLKEFNFDYEKNIFRSYAKAKITIHHFLTTTWLETLGTNIPTICFYDKNSHRFNDDAQEAMNLLNQNGILHDNVEDAVKFLNKIEKSALDWWLSKEVQEARRNFTEQFCLFETKWSSSWEKFFLSII